MAETNTGTNNRNNKEKVHNKKFDSLKKKWEMELYHKRHTERLGCAE